MESLLAAKEDYYHRIAYTQLQRNQSQTAELSFFIMKNMISEGLSKGSAYEVDYSSYQLFLNVDTTAYQLYVLFIEDENLRNDCMSFMQEYQALNAPAISFYSLYVKDQFFLFFEDYGKAYTQLEAALCPFSVNRELMLHLQTLPRCSAVVLTDFLLSLNEQQQTSNVLTLTKAKLTDILASSKSNAFSESIARYVENNISDPNLTLKKIAEEYLYMNVDYVSRKFSKDTGKKFSQYITEIRIEKAKHLLQTENEKGQIVAKQVGFGDSYQYFSQIFKKHTGMTPMAYAKACKNDS